MQPSKIVNIGKWKAAHLKEMLAISLKRVTVRDEAGAA
jgi:hypothetical protein